MWDVFTERTDKYNACQAAEAFISMHPYGTRYMCGYKTLVYNTVEEVEADVNNRFSKLWQAVNEGSGVAINLPAAKSDELWRTNTSLRKNGFSYVQAAYQNPLSDVAKENDKTRSSTAYALESQIQPVAASIPSLSNYLN